MLHGIKMIYFITSNENKFKEAKEIFAEHGLEIEQKKVPYPEIQADTLEEVVEEGLKNIDDENVFIEDAGLFVDALGGFPGVYSRYVEDVLGNEAVLKLLKDVKERRAVFKSVVGYKGNGIEIFTGTVEGTITDEQKGTAGFGYDPIFVPKGFNNTFAEDFNLKMRLSHRKQAMESLAKHLSGKS
jgi:XTP/dITP diphosphohydrolase